MAQPKFRGALYSRLMRQLRENDYGCFTDEKRQEYFKRIALTYPPAPRGKPGHPPSWWTQKAGIKAPETPSDWADLTLPDLPADFDRRWWWQKGKRF